MCQQYIEKQYAGYLFQCQSGVFASSFKIVISHGSLKFMHLLLLWFFCWFFFLKKILQALYFRQDKSISYRKYICRLFSKSKILNIMGILFKCFWNLNSHFLVKNKIKKAHLFPVEIIFYKVFYNTVPDNCASANVAFMTCQS